VRIDSWGVVHPDYWGRGLGGYLLAWAEERARRSVPLAPEGAQVVFQQGIDARDEAGARLFLACGYQPVRQYWVMKIEFDRPIQPLPELDGLNIRPMLAGEERALVAATDDAFKDHWGHVDEPFERTFERFMSRLNDPFMNRSLWFVAEEGGEIAGVSLCSWGTPEDRELGWVNTLGVRRPWRKRGLGLALLLHSFHELKKLGKHGAGLGVDSSSLTGATRLYEKGGMHVAERRDMYRKELRPGVDLTTQQVE
jgi:GNAT superfamily N-acetyltransferase